MRVALLEFRNTIFDFLSIDHLFYGNISIKFFVGEIIFDKIVKNLLRDAKRIIIYYAHSVKRDFN